MNTSPLPPSTGKITPNDTKLIQDSREFNLEESSHSRRQKLVRTDLRVLGGGFQMGSPHFKQTQTVYEGFAINYIASGKGLVEQNGQKSPLVSGSLFAVQPRTSYKIENEGSNPLVQYQIRFKGDQAGKLLTKTFLSDGLPHNLSRLSWVKETFVNIQECGEDAKANSQAACELLLEYLLTRLEHTELPAANNNTPAFTVFENCRNFIETFYPTINGAHEIAEASHISHQYLCYLFKRFSKETPTQMVLRLKLTHSAELLKKGNLLIKEIAQEVGFEDQYYFSKRFKDFFGVSPTNYLGSAFERANA